MVLYICCKHHYSLIYRQQNPKSHLKNCIKSFWQIDNQKRTAIVKEKIIPDGYPELIFHYKSPYKSNISGKWFAQEKFIIAGQIKNHFYLENTGPIGMFGIKLQPWALKQLFDIDMSKLTDKVVGFDANLIEQLQPIADIAINAMSFEAKVQAIETWMKQHLNIENTNSDGQKAITLIIKRKGEISIQEVLNQVNVSERTLERYFKTHIGLSPKFYSRIIRFSNIFNLVQDKNFNWSDITFLAGFYDQSHFIKNFKEFTGEEPSSYGFTEENMANFFLKP